ncbi:hypothetical protein MNBD_GAMMA11-2025 [hydrothermal vent metagenome]|uniref:Uncharacterized protein n=1 Tax=hydrothermal vent metagenome TaxID=652676 RepID=A0A3B0YBM0_9ZZZZ
MNSMHLLYVAKLPMKDCNYINDFSLMYGSDKGVAKREECLFNSEVDLVKKYTKNFVKKIRLRFYIHKAKASIGISD